MIFSLIHFRFLSVDEKGFPHLKEVVMKQPMTFEETSYELLKQRSARLVGLVKSRNRVLIPSEVWLVLEAAAGYCGQNFGSNFFEPLLGRLRVEQGFCAGCSVQKAKKGSNLCNGCAKDFQPLERKEQEEALVRRIFGPQPPKPKPRKKRK